LHRGCGAGLEWRLLLGTVAAVGCTLGLAGLVAGATKLCSPSTSAGHALGVGCVTVSPLQLMVAFGHG